MKDLVVLSSDSHTLDGCDRVMLSGDQVIVQGKPANRADFPSIRVPDDETLNTVSVRVFLEAARELERQLGTAMSDVDLLGMYGRATQEAFRLEAQQRYAVPAEDAQFRAFTEGRPLPSDPRVNRSMQVIRTAVASGCRDSAGPRRGSPAHGVPAL